MTWPAGWARTRFGSRPQCRVDGWSASRFQCHASEFVGTSVRSWRARRLTARRCKIPLALGKDIAGKAIVGDLARMPHLLIAGATGSGKSVCINSIVACFLSQFAPNQLQLIMIDPKMVELICLQRRAAPPHACRYGDGTGRGHAEVGHPGDGEALQALPEARRPATSTATTASRRRSRTRSRCPTSCSSSTSWPT